MLDATFHALAEPRRRAILRELGDRELTAGEIASLFAVTRPAISQHLAVLRAARLVEERRDGTRRWYRARRDGLVPVRDWVGSFWDEQLDALRVAIDDDRRRTEAGDA
jgi:DNA-binding transcriptional ArsR family regulator